MKYSCKQCGWDCDGPGYLAMHLICHHDAKPSEAMAEAGAGFELTAAPTRRWYPADKVDELLRQVERADELLASTMAQCERLRERAEKAEVEVKRVRDLIDRDRTGLAAALDNVRKILEGYGWLAEYGGWGSYDYTQQTVTTLRKEIGWMMDAALTAIKKGMNESGERANSAFHPEKDVDEKGG